MIVFSLSKCYHVLLCVFDLILKLPSGLIYEQSFQMSKRKLTRHAYRQEPNIALCRG